MSADSLVNSKSMAGLDHHIDVLKGSKDCLFFHDMNNNLRNISVCISDKNTTNQILDAFTYLQKCSNYKGSRGMSKEETLERLLNTLDNPDQDVYKLPNFKRALKESLTEKGVN